MESEAVLLETDYFVIGAGATAMTFVDELVNSSTDITFIIIDKHAKPGGHWNDAYDFVTLHQPAAYYGVRSKPLGTGGNDLVSKSQILAYYELVMKDLLASGRVKFYLQCEATSNDEFVSMMDTDVKYKVNIRKKTVDAKYLMTEVPSVVKPQFKISDGVHFMPINYLSHNQSPWNRYVVIGGGKTGIDAILFLLKQNVSPGRIIWIIPNDMWMLNRAAIFCDQTTKTIIGMVNGIIGCEHHDDLYERWEKIGVMMRLDTNIKPRRMKAATVSVEELENLRRITHVVRQGRIECIEPTRIVFKDGSEITTNENTLHVDCSANGIKHPPKKEIYDDKTIYLQSVIPFQPVYSASIIAAYEHRFPEDSEKKNELLKPVPHATYPHEYIVNMRDSQINEDAIGKVIGMTWLRSNRLNSLYHVSFFGFCQILITILRCKSAINEALEKMIANIEHTTSA